MRNLIVGLAVVAILAASASAAPDWTAFRSTWVSNPGTTGAWETASNWTSQYRPHDDTTGYGDWTSMTATVPGHGWEVFTNGSGSTDGNIGTIEFSATSTTVTVGILNGNYNRTPAHFLMSGGLLTVNTGSNPYYLNETLSLGRCWSSSKETPTFTITGGTVDFANSWAKMGYDNGSGEVICKGGKFDANTFKAKGTTQFTIDNSVGTPTMVFGTFDLDEGGTADLKVVLNTSGGSAAITANTASVKHTIYVDDAAAEAASNLFVGKTVDLIVASTLNDAGMSVDGTRWVKDGTAPAGTLRIKCLVPEPATMSLLVLGGLGVLIRRRRK